jgi:hypothetical protein
VLGVARRAASDGGDATREPLLQRSFRALGGDAQMNASNDSSCDRRTDLRHDATLVISIECSDRRDRFGIARNASAGGVLFNTPSRFAPDEEMTIAILFPTRPQIRAKAHVVRVENAPPGLPWRYAVAAQFDARQPELARVLSGLAWD